MTAISDAPVTGPLTPTAISRLAVPELEELQRPGVRGFFTSQLREEGLTSNWFRALSLNEGDLERLNGYLLPLLGTDGRGGLTAREREVIATVVSGENRCAYCHTNHANKLGKVAGDWSFGQRVAIDHHQVAELTERERALADLAAAVTTTRNPAGTTTSQGCVSSDSTTTKSWKVSRSRPLSVPPTASASHWRCHPIPNTPAFRPDRGAPAPRVGRHGDPTLHSGCRDRRRCNLWRDRLLDARTGSRRHHGEGDDQR